MKYAALLLLLGYGFIAACATDDASFGNGSGGSTTSAGGSTQASGGATNSAGGNGTGGSATSAGGATASSTSASGSGGMSNGMCGQLTCGPNDLCCANTYCYPASCSVCCQGGQGGGNMVSSSSISVGVGGFGGFLTTTTSGGGGGVTCGNMTCQPGWNCCQISNTFYCLPTMCP